MRNASYRLTVGILSWNRKDALEVALRSVAKQTIFAGVETIVYDSNSSDGSSEMVEERFPWVRLIESDINPGLAEGRNILVRLASAPVVFWMDDDCELVEDDLLEKMLDFINNNPQIGVLYANIPEGDTDKTFQHLYIPTDLDRRDFAHRKLITSTFASGATCVKKDLFLACGGYDTSYFRMQVENDFSYRIYDSGHYICYNPEVTVIHRPHAHGRNNEVIMYYSIRNKFWGYWRNLPLSWAMASTAIELPMSFLRAVKKRTLKSWFRAIISTFTAMPRRRALRKPMSQTGLSAWASARHYIIEWDTEIIYISKYSLRRFFWMEIKTRILSQMGVWRRRPDNVFLVPTTLESPHLCNK